MAAETAASKRIVLALAGDAMLGRRVAKEFDGASLPGLFSSELKAAIGEADLFVLNLECCISDGGTPWPDPRKPFFFRAPPQAAELLASIGVDCVTLANNHALDFGRAALLDTMEHLGRVGIPAVGAGAGLSQARAPVVIESGGFRLAVVGIADHPADFAADIDRPGVAFADLWSGEVPEWLLETLATARARADAVLLSPHWGPNLTSRPPDHVRTAAAALRSHATLIAGHSAHVFHGVERNVLYDLGDFVNDYVSPRPSPNLFMGILRKIRKEVSGFSSEVTTALNPKRRKALAIVHPNEINARNSNSRAAYSPRTASAIRFS